jgi:hypothetical protein
MDYLRDNSGRFFRNVEFDPVEMAEMIAGEAIRAGANNVHIFRRNHWLLIDSDMDWLREVESIVFDKIVPFPGAGPNSMFAEVLLMAFSKSVATASVAGVRIIKGVDAGPLTDATLLPGRSVAFELPGL